MNDTTNLKRRGFLSTAALGIVAAQASLMGAAQAAPAGARASFAAAGSGISPASNTFTDIRQIRAGVLSHWVHHRGQLTVYMKMLGVAVPSIYGPSGDEPSKPA